MGHSLGQPDLLVFVIKHLDLGQDIPLFGKGTRRQDYFDIRVLASVCLQIYDNNTKHLQPLKKQNIQ